MSEKSFAVASVSVAIVWGTFFYPPMPHKAIPADASTPISAGVTVERLRADKGSLLPTPSRPAALKTALKTTAEHRCVLTTTPDITGCAPLHKLAGD